MLPKIFDSANISALHEVVHFTQSRHSVLAGNVANWDTPGYRVRDLSTETFQQRLREAMELRAGLVSGGGPSEPMSLGNATNPQDPIRQVRESLEHILYHDESNVSLEHQVTEIAKNQYLHNVAVAILGSQYRLLQTAISERV